MGVSGPGVLVGTLHLGGQQITAWGLEKKKGMSGLSALKPSNKSIEVGSASCGRNSRQEEPRFLSHPKVKESRVDACR
jgi:hypothetical protein